MKRLAVLCAVLVLVVGCAECASYFNGLTGAPFDHDHDLQGWYHAGALTLPIISQIVAILRLIWPLLVPLIL